MPIPPQPMTYHCPSCGWKRTVTPRSDCLVLGKDIFSDCPRCHAVLAVHPASSIEILLAKLFQRTS